LTDPDAGLPAGEDIESERLAAWWKRLVAILIDGLIVGAVSMAVWVALGGDVPKAGDQNLNAVRGLAFVQLGLGLLYFGALNGSPRGQTVGKTALKIRVRDARAGGPIGFGRGMVRFGFVWVLGILRVPVVIDGLWALFDPNRQTWHDKVARSIVIDVADDATPEN
jgi:uncharacterized RDD family membrane protein YckC